MVTAMGLLYFAQEDVDWAIVEVGMGGRLDATNVIHPQVSVITNVSLDHQEFLGRTLSAIAREKPASSKIGSLSSPALNNRWYKVRSKWPVTNMMRPFIG